MHLVKVQVLDSNEFCRLSFISIHFVSHLGMALFGLDALLFCSDGVRKIKTVEARG